MRVINAPNHGHLYPNDVAVFLAGGIKGCRDWQTEFIEYCSSEPDQLVLCNPRAGVFDSADPDRFRRQVEWEFDYLRHAKIISFWFSKETLNPITLYEFGFQMAECSRSKRPIFVGADHEYQKFDDVLIQSHLAGWVGEIDFSVKALAKKVCDSFHRVRNYL